MSEVTQYTVLILLAVVMMFAAVMAKVFVATHLHSLKRRNAVADSDLQQLSGRLKAVRDQKAMVKNKEAKLVLQKARLAKKIAKTQGVLIEYKSGQANRQQVRDQVRGKLTRPSSDETT